MTNRRIGMREFRKTLNVGELTEPLLVTRHKRETALVLPLTSLPDVDGDPSLLANRQKNVARAVESFLRNEKALRRHIEEVITAMEARLRFFSVFAAELDRRRAMSPLENATHSQGDDFNPSSNPPNGPVTPK